MKRIAVALSAALALAACSAPANQENNALPAPAVSDGQNVMGGTLHNVKFNDGTECYIVDANKSGAMSCDFSRSTAPAQGPAGVIEQSEVLRLVRTPQGDICAVYDGYHASGLACRFQ